MSIFDDEQSGIEPHPRATLFYGVHGIGKSTWASNAPNPIWLDTELSSLDLNVRRFICKDKGLDYFGGKIKGLHEEDHDRKTVVIDTVDWLEQMVWDAVAKKEKVKRIDDIGYQKGYKFALTIWRAILQDLDKIKSRGINIVLLAHCTHTKVDLPTGESYTAWCPALHKDASAIIQQWSDEVLFANYVVRAIEKDKGFNQKQGVGIGSGERVVYTTELPSRQAKNRLSMPDEIGMHWDEYAKYFNRTETE